MEAQVWFLYDLCSRCIRTLQVWCVSFYSDVEGFQEIKFEEENRRCCNLEKTSTSHRRCIEECGD